MLSDDLFEITQQLCDIYKSHKPYYREEVMGRLEAVIIEIIRLMMELDCEPGSSISPKAINALNGGLENYIKFMCEE
jgi:hypothetical protein